MPASEQLAGGARAEAGGVTGTPLAAEPSVVVAGPVASVPEARGPKVEWAVARLRLVRRLARGLLVAENVSWVVSGTIAAGVLIGLVDWFLRTPGWMRGMVLLVALAALAAAIWRRVLPAARFAPSLEDLALRVERTASAKSAGLDGLLASGVGLARPSSPEPALSTALAAPVVSDAMRRFDKVGTLSVLDIRRPARAVAFGLLALTTQATLFAVMPGLTWIGTRRLLTPWTSAQWPKRFAVADATVDASARDVHPLGRALALRAGLVRSALGPGATDVEANYRLIVDGRAGPTRRLEMTNQDRDVSVAMTDDLGVEQRAKGVLFERLIDAAGLSPQAEGAKGPRAAGAPLPAPVNAEVEYWFTAGDDSTPPRRLRLVEPPAVTSAKAVVTPPAYAQGTSEGQARTVDLGAGTDERATLAGVLEGSRVELTFELNKDVPVPGATKEPAKDGPKDAAAKRALGDAAAAMLERPDTRVSFEPRRWTLSFVAREAMRLPVRIVDEYGIESTDEPVFRVEARADRPPEAAVTKPAEDMDVLPTAVVDVSAEGRDDLAVTGVSLNYRMAKVPAAAAGSAGPAPEGEAKSATLATTTPTGPVRTASVAGQLDLAALQATAGQEVWLTAVATDGYELDGKKHDPATSAVRRLRVISSEQLGEQLWNDLAGVRRSAMRGSEQQEQNTRNVRNGQSAAAAEHDQTNVSDTLQRMAEAVDRVRERARANGMSDEELNGIIRQSRDLIDEAKAASTQAQEALKRAENDPADEAAAKAQRESTPSEPKGGDQRGSDPKTGEQKSGRAGEQPQGQPSGQQDGQPNPNGEQGGDQKNSDQRTGQQSPNGQKNQNGQNQNGQTNQGSQQNQNGQKQAGQNQQGQEPSGQKQNGQQADGQRSDPKADDKRPDRPAATPGTADRREAVEQGDKARKALDQIAEVLDRGQDSWTSRRAVERLIEDQKNVREQTKQLGRETTGKSEQELTDQQRQAAEKIAQQQQELANRTSEAAKRMAERAEQVRANDPATADAMKQAAQKAEQSNVAEQMQKTAEQIRKNQQDSAGQNQEQAEQSLEQMLDELKNASATRDATLRRQLASLVEAINGLVRKQETEIGALEKAKPAAAFAGLDAGMIKLHSMTLSVADQARGAGAEARAAGDLVASAGEEQSGAVSALRAAPVNDSGASTDEQASLTKLRDARDAANKAKSEAEKRDQQRKLQQLRQQYTELLLEQTAIKQDASALATPEPDRRTRARARELAERQEKLRLKAADLVQKNEDLTASALFPLAHERLDSATSAATKMLREGTLSPVLVAEESIAVRTLQALVDALDESQKQKQDDFREQAQDEQEQGGQGGQGGQGQQPLIPPIAELRALRNLQAEALAVTREASEMKDAAGAKMLQGDAAKLQSGLASKAAELMAKLTGGGGDALPGAGGAGPKPEPKVGPKGEPKKDEGAKTDGGEGKRENHP